MSQKKNSKIRSKNPPKPLKKLIFHKKFQNKRSDSYHWMREKDSTEVLEHLKRENQYAKAKLKPTKTLQKSIFKEIKDRLPESYASEPVKWDNYFYFRSWKKGQSYPIHKRKRRHKGKVEVLLDENKLAGSQAYCDMGEMQVAPDHNVLAYALDTKGRELYNIFFKNLQTGKNLSCSIKNVTSDFVWANDSETLFYVKQDPVTLRPFQVFRFHIPTQQSELIFEEQDTAFNVHLHKTLSKDYIAILSKSIQTSEWRFLNAHSPFEDFRLFLKRKTKHLYYLDGGGGSFYILTNKDSAFNFKLMKVSLAKGKLSGWRELIPHREDVFLEDLYVFKEFVVLKGKKKGAPTIFILDRRSEKVHAVSFPDLIYSCEIGENAEYNTSLVRLDYSSLVCPPTVYDYDVKERKLIFRRRMSIKKSFSHGDYFCRREWVVSRDGIKIPLTLIYRKDLKLGPKTPLLLYAYGSYGISVDPSFNPSIFSLLDRGFVYAIAHVRGGSELGKKWYEQGKFLKKKNTFRDFIDCAQHCIERSYTSSNHLYAFGGSAGGLLIGAILNERPDLFRGAVASVPFVDVLTTLLDESIPLSVGEYEEWGNPSNKTYYNYIKSYSPYDNVKKTAYPYLLIKTGYHDPRVPYWEPAKWVARLRELKTDNRDMLLLTEMDSGHFGVTGRYERMKTAALFYAFLLNLEVRTGNGKSGKL